MDIITGVEVECADGPCGRSRYVILNPADTTITHVVVSESVQDDRTHLVPLSYVAGGSPRQIRLKCTRAELQALPQFSEYRVDEAEESRSADAPPEMWLSPVEGAWPVVGAGTGRQPSDSRLSIPRGARVQATDGYVGSVEELAVEPASGRITHLTVRRGQLWGRRLVEVPPSEIHHVEHDTVFLKIDKARLRALPSFRPGRRREEAAGSPTPPPDGKIDTAGQLAINALIMDLNSADWTTRERARSTLVAMGDAAVAGLAAALHNKDRHTRWEAIKTLRQVHSTAATPALVAALEDPGPGIRWIAAESLAELGRPGVIALLKALMVEPDSPQLQRGAYRVLHALHDPALEKQLEPVLAALKDLEPELVAPVAAHEALVAMGGIP